MNVNDLFTLIHFHLFQNWYYVSNGSTISIMFLLTLCTIMNTRLATMSVSLYTQTVLHCLIIQVLTQESDS